MQPTSGECSRGTLIFKLASQQKLIAFVTQVFSTGQRNGKNHFACYDCGAFFEQESYLRYVLNSFLIDLDENNELF